MRRGCIIRGRPLSIVAALLWFFATLAFPGCGHHGKPAGETSNLIFRDTEGSEVARAWMALPARVPGPGQAFSGAFHVTSARGDFPTLSSNGYAAFVGEGGQSINANLNPNVADHNVTLAGKTGAGEVRGTWALSTFGGVKPRGTFVLAWPGK